MQQTLILSKQVNGEDSIMYFLVPSATQIHKSADGFLTPTTISCKQMKKVGNQDASESKDLTLKYKLSNTNETTYNYGEIAIGSAEWILFTLYDSNNKIIDNINIAVINDGLPAPNKNPNMFLQSSFDNEVNYWHQEGGTRTVESGLNGKKCLHTVYVDSIVGFNDIGFYLSSNLAFPLNANSWYTCSFWTKGTIGNQLGFYFWSSSLSALASLYLDNVYLGTAKSANITLTSEWTQHIIKFKLASTIPESLGYFRITSGEAYICMPKLEVGELATGYCLADSELIGGQGIQGCIIRDSEWVESTEYLNQSNDTTDGIRYIDVVLESDDTQSTGWNAWQCMKTHISSQSNKPQKGETTQYWKPFSSNVVNIFTSLIIAKNAKIKFLQGNQLLLMGDGGNIVGGMSGFSTNSGDIRLWIGSQTPSDAPYSVSEDGSFKSTKANITGEINATSGKIAYFNIDNGNISCETGGSLQFTQDTMTNTFGLNNTSTIMAINNSTTDYVLQSIEFNLLENRKTATNGIKSWKNITIANSYDIQFKGYTDGDDYGYQYADLGRGHIVMDGIVEGTSLTDFTKIFKKNNSIMCLRPPLHSNRILVSSSYVNCVLMLPDRSTMEACVGINLKPTNTNREKFSFSFDIINKGNKDIYISGMSKLQASGGTPFYTHLYPKMYWSGSSNIEATAPYAFVAPKRAIRIILEYDGYDYIAMNAQ